MEPWSLRACLSWRCCRFSDVTAGLPPEQMINVLNTLYSAFDVLSNFHDSYKVETVGPVYMVVGGCPQESGNHAELLAHLGACSSPVVRWASVCPGHGGAHSTRSPCCTRHLFLLRSAGHAASHA